MFVALNPNGLERLPHQARAGERDTHPPPRIVERFDGDAIAVGQSVSAAHSRGGGYLGRVTAVSLPFGFPREESHSRDSLERARV
jgi:hypothetical protein